MSRAGRPVGHDGEDTRDAILHSIRSSLGIHRSRLCEETGLAWGTVGHHLAILERQGRIASITVGRRRVFYDGRVPEAHRVGLAALSDKAARDVIRDLLRHARKNQHVSRSYLEVTCSQPRRKARKGIADLMEAQLIEEDVEGGVLLSKRTHDLMACYGTIIR